MALCLVPLFSSTSNSQDILTTPNIVSQTAWQGCATYLPTRIWGGYSGGPCPNVGLNGTGINYSYGDVTLSQTIAVNQALANAGSNLQVNGYNYSWQVKNSNINGAQGGSYDPIATISVNLLGKSNNVLSSDVYNYGYHLPNWTTFSGTKTYDNPYAMDALGSIGISVRSKDSGYWAGYYGPEFQNFRLSLNYSVTQPPAPVTPPTVPSSSSFSVATVVTKTVSVTATSSDPTSSPVTNVNVGGVELSTTGTISAPDGVPQTVKDVVASAPAQTAPATTTTSSESSSTTAVAGTKTETKAGAPMSLIMSTISKIQEADKATQKAAVQNAAQQVSLSVSKSQDQAASVVSSLNAMSAASSQESSQTTTSQQQQSTTQVLSMPGAQQNVQTNNSQQQQQSIQQVVSMPVQQTQQSANQVNVQSTAPVAVTSFTLPTQGRTVQTYTAPSAQSMGVSYSLFTPPVAIQAPQPTYAPPVTMTVDVPVLQTNAINSRTNPLAEMMEAKNFFSTNQVEQKQDTVNRNVQMNELAGGVDITAIANIPKGYDAYTTLTLADGRFYKPEEIYKNQTTTDNVRVLRGLTGGSDRLHQEMINQQFKLGR